MRCCRLLWAAGLVAMASSSDVDPTMEYLRGTTWRWNNWRDVTFECDGKFSAPTPDCESGHCRWSADGAGQIVIQWGQAGRHTLQQARGAGQAVRGALLRGYRDRDRDPCAAEFVKTEECTPDWYEVLGVGTEASTRDIKKRYRQLSLELHPDKPGGDAEKFAKVADAYAVLGDADSRALYDQKTGRGDGRVRFYGEEQSVVQSIDARGFNSKDPAVLHIIDCEDSSLRPPPEKPHRGAACSLRAVVRPLSGTRAAVPQSGAGARQRRRGQGRLPRRQLRRAGPHVRRSGRAELPLRPCVLLGAGH